MALSAVIFDMDGVLIDSEPIIRGAAQLAAMEIDRTITDHFYASLLGLPSPQVEVAFMREFGHDFPLADFRHRFERCYRSEIDHRGLAAKPGIPMLLDELLARGIPIAVATSTRANNAASALAATGLLARLAVCVTGDQVQNGKPAPDIFLLAASRIGVAPQNCIAVEDSEVGARAAVAAGMYTLLVPDLKQPSEELANLVAEIYSSMPLAARRILTLLAANP
ncbi:MAG: HAD family phosphatase [Gammaproteobacteria bacterium]|nr:HAD family phosphatase [Gammaproteobacteria bacterium]